MIGLLLYLSLLAAQDTGLSRTGFAAQNPNVNCAVFPGCPTSKSSNVNSMCGVDRWCPEDIVGLETLSVPTGNTVYRDSTCHCLMASISGRQFFLVEEPTTVPAIREDVETNYILVCKKPEGCKETELTWQTSDLHSFWTCADKSRVLLTSEDGKKHCIKF